MCPPNFLIYHVYFLSILESFPDKPANRDCFHWSSLDCRPLAVAPSHGFCFDNGSAGEKRALWRGVGIWLCLKNEYPIPRFILPIEVGSTSHFRTAYISGMILFWFPMHLLTCVQPPASDMKPDHPVGLRMPDQLSRRFCLFWSRLDLEWLTLW